MFNSAKLWVMNVIGLEKRPITCEDFEAFWTEYGRENCHLNPTIFGDDVLLKYQVCVKICT